MSRKRKIRVDLIDRSVYGSIIDEQNYCTDKIVDVIAWLQGLLTAVPEESRNESYIDFRVFTEYDLGNIEMSVYYMRDETDAERDARIRRHDEIVRDAAAAQESKDREEFARLKAKFEP